GGDRGAGDGALAVLERVRIVVQDGDRGGLAGVDRDGVPAGGDEVRLRAADGGLDRRGNGGGRAVLDGDGDVDDGSLGDFRAGLHTQGGAVEGDAELTAGRPLAEGEVELVPLRVLRPGGEVERGGGAALLHVELGAAEGGREVLLLGLDDD